MVKKIVQEKFVFVPTERQVQLEANNNDFCPKVYLRREEQGTFDNDKFSVVNHKRQKEFVFTGYTSKEEVIEARRILKAIDKALEIAEGELPYMPF